MSELFILIIFELDSKKAIEQTKEFLFNSGFLFQSIHILWTTVFFYDMSWSGFILNILFTPFLGVDKFSQYDFFLKFILLFSNSSLKLFSI